MSVPQAFSRAPLVSVPVFPLPSCDLRRLTLPEYHWMIEAGILTTADKVQLLEGLLVIMPPIGPEHSYSVQQAAQVLTGLLPNGWFVRQLTFGLSEPEPDVVVVRGEPADYKLFHPSAVDIALVGEVAASSLALDRHEKLRIYAGARIPEYWILNLEDRQLEVYREPQGAVRTYAFHRVLDATDSVVASVAGQPLGEISIAALLP